MILISGLHVSPDPEATLALYRDRCQVPQHERPPAWQPSSCISARSVGTTEENAETGTVMWQASQTRRGPFCLVSTVPKFVAKLGTVRGLQNGSCSRTYTSPAGSLPVSYPCFSRGMLLLRTRSALMLATMSLKGCSLDVAQTMYAMDAQLTFFAPSTPAAEALPHHSTGTPRMSGCFSFALHSLVVTSAPRHVLSGRRAGFSDQHREQPLRQRP